LKHGWMKFWLCGSLLLALQCFPALGAQMAQQKPSRVPSQSKVHGVNETLLAGLRPGRDTFAMAEKRFKSKNLAEGHDSGIKEWRDDCSGRAIRLELDAKSLIQSVTITTLGYQDSKCGEKLADFLDPKYWVTGLGLRIGDSQDRVVDFYGEPNSSGPATKNGRELELMFYQFDWAGSDVPQVMEVLCARDTGRVVEITLAFPSL
jgi:hypothetical protein